MEPEEHRPAVMTLGQKMVRISLTILVLLLVAGLATPLWLKSRMVADRAEALNNAKQIGAMLSEFEADYGSLPDDETALEVKRRTETDFTLTGQFSNDYFRQMLAADKEKSEMPFWCKTKQSPYAPDKVFSTAAKALEAGEVGFSYIMASPTEGQVIDGDPLRPVVISPSQNFQADWTFDPEPYAGTAMVLRMDLSATPMSIRKDNKKVSTNSGKTLGDTGEGTPWGKSVAPFMRAPQPRPEGK